MVTYSLENRFAKVGLKLHIIDGLSQYIDIGLIGNLKQAKGVNRILYDDTEDSQLQFYKNHTKNHILYSNEVAGINFFIKDTLDHMNWVLTDEKKRNTGYALQICKDIL